MKIKNIIKIFFTLSLLVGSSTPSVGINVVRADTSSSTYTVLAPLPCIEGSGIKCEGGNGALQEKVDFKTYVQYTFNLLIALSAVAAVTMIVWGGIEYVITGSFEGKKASISKVTNAVYGLILVLCSFIILRTIDPRLVEIPTTLVPEISLRPELVVDTRSSLIKGLEAEANEYKLKREEEKAILNKTSKELSAAYTELDDIKAKLAADPENRELQLAKEKAELKVNEVRVNNTVQLAKTAFNQALVEATTDAADQDSNVPTVIAKLNTGKKIISNLLNTATSTIVSLGQNDLSTLNSAANYSAAVIDLKIMQTRISDARLEYTSSGMGVGGGGTYATGRIVIKDSNGSAQYIGIAQARTNLQSELSKLKSSADNIKDESMKADLLKKVNALTADLNSDSKFKK